MEPPVLVRPSTPLQQQLSSHDLEKPSELPNSDSPYLHLTQPTPDECVQIWTNTATSWKGPLTVAAHVAEGQYLETVPLARDGGMTTWVLVDRRLPPGERQVICSCESYRKRCLISNEAGKAEGGIIHGVACVFTPSKYRGRGYGVRHMKELAKVLQDWQSEYGKSVGSILHSDIGKNYYAKMGWQPNQSNWHLSFGPQKIEKPEESRPIHESDLEELCDLDEEIIQKAMTAPSTTRKRVAIIPSLDHMLWHLRKEDFVTEFIFGKKAEVKGAIAGSPGKRVWAIWTRRYYGHPDHPDEQKSGHDNNILYILRLVVEGDDTANKPRGDNSEPPTEDYKEQAAALKAIIQAAQSEANNWRLDHVELWEPSPLAYSLLRAHTDLDAKFVDRHEDGIASVLWFEQHGCNTVDTPVWVNNEHFAWC